MSQVRHFSLIVIALLLFGLVVWTPKTLKHWCFWGISGIVLFVTAYFLR
jgi:hypothetical protein